MADDPKTTYDEVASDLTTTSPATLSKMFGMPCLKIGSKAFAGYVENSMVFKLSGAPHARALALAGAHLFDPGMGRSMKEWVVVPLEHASSWPELGRDALEYVGKMASSS
jgi:hypothetical protein